MTDERHENAKIEALYSAHLETVTARFEAAMAATGQERIVIFAGDEVLVGRDDQPYPFHAEPYFLQWLPLIHAPGSALEIVAGKRPRLWFVQPRDYWHVPPAAPDAHWVSHLDIEIADSAEAAQRGLAAGKRRTAAIGAPAQLAGQFATSDDRDLLDALDFDRAFKTPYEAACIAEASRIAARGHAAVAAAFDEPVSEFALNLIYCEATSQRETELPYRNIIALDEHAAVLHYQNLSHASPGERRSFLIDAGAGCAGYASDISRTYVQNDGEFEALIESMHALQQTLCGEVRAGVDFVELNEQAHRLLSEVLAEHGLLRCSAAEAYETGITRTFLPHGLGHLLGLQVHDAGGRQISPGGGLRPPPDGHPFLRLTRELSAGFVLTVEPGLYFIPSLLDELDGAQRAGIDREAAERLIPLGGIRIEDDLLVELDGARNLTREAFTSL